MNHPRAARTRAAALLARLALRCAHPAPVLPPGVDDPAVPPAGPPLLPVIRLEPEARALVGARSQGPALPPAGTGPGPVPLRHH